MVITLAAASSVVIVVVLPDAVVALLLLLLLFVNIPSQAVVSPAHAALVTSSPRVYYRSTLPCYFFWFSLLQYVCCMCWWG